MTALPKITVVIPCYNAVRYIAATIQSVLAQGWPNLEILVIDDGSSDGSAALVQNMYPEVRLVQQTNQGVAAARNNGIDQAQGAWIAFLDADDIWLPGKLQAQWAMLQALPGARMAYTAWQVWPSTEPVPSQTDLAKLNADSDNATRWSGATGWVYPQLLLDCVVWTSTVLVHKSVLSEVGVFDTTLRIGEDYDLWLRASRVTQILRVPQPFAFYRMHPASITKSVPEKNFRALVVDRAISRWGYASPDGRVAAKSVVDNALAKSWSDYAGALLDAGHFKESRLASQKALFHNWRHTSGLKVWIKSLLWPLYQPKN